MDETSWKIIDATTLLVRDTGYVVAITKDIARVAGINECILFCKFQRKKILKYLLPKNQLLILCWLKSNLNLLWSTEKLDNIKNWAKTKTSRFICRFNYYLWW